MNISHWIPYSIDRSSVGSGAGYFRTFPMRWPDGFVGRVDVDVPRPVWISRAYLIVEDLPDQIRGKLYRVVDSLERHYG